MKNFIKQYTLLAIIILIVSGNSFGQVVVSHDFNSSDDGWTSGGAVNGMSWTRGTDPFMDNATNVWSTSPFNNYPSSAGAYLQSQVFDFSAYSGMELSVDVQVNSEAGYDGVSLFYSLDGGTSWSQLGTQAAGFYTATGVNGINDRYTEITSDPDGWTGTSQTDFATYTVSLPGALESASVIFRFYFGSDGDTNKDGAAIDNFLIMIPLNEDSKILSSATLTEPTTISSILDTEGTKLDVFDFTFEDLASGDATATIIDQLQIIPGTTNSIADWTTTIAGVRLDGPDQTAMVGTINATDITFSADDMISIADGGSEEYTLSIWLKLSVTEGDILDFKISDGSVTCDVAGSTFGTYSTESGSETITVVATDLGFIEQPRNVLPNVAMTEDVTVGGVDENGNFDEDFSGTISLSSDGTLTGDPVSQATVAGVATFSGLVHTVQENARTLTVTYITPDPDWVADSELFDVYEVDCGAADIPTNECVDAPMIDLSQPFLGSTSCSYDVSNNENLNGSPCSGHGMDNDSWIKFQAAATEIELEVEVGTCSGGNSGIQLAVFSGDCATGLDEIPGSCAGPGTYPDNAETIFVWNFTGLTIGAEYIIRIDGYAGQDCDYWFTPISGIVIIPPNDDCEDALELTCGGANLVSNIMATEGTLPIGCTGGGTPSKGVWYTMTGTGEVFTVSTDNPGTNFDTELNVYIGSCASLVCIGGDDNGGTGTTSEFTFTSVNGTEYYVYVDGNGASEGQLEIGLTCTGISSPVITVQPTDQTVCLETESVAFALTATNADSYQWQVHSTVWTDITNGGVYSNATTNTLNISDATGLIGAQYRCNITNAAGTTTSNTVTIIDGAPVAPTTVAATFTAITVGGNTTLSYTGGSGDSFEWYSGSCGGTSVGSGNNLVVSPIVTTTYYGRWENACGETACLSIEITVNPVLYTISGTLKYDNTATTALASQTIKLMQGVSQIGSDATTDASGNYSFSNIVNGIYTVEPDVTLDWKGVTAMDATHYRKHIAAVTLLTDLRWRSGDIISPATPPANPTLTAADLTPIYQRIVTQISTFAAVGNFAYSDGATTVAGADETVAMRAICYGDANASYSFAKNGLDPITTENNDVFYFDNQDEFEIPVKVVNPINNLSSVTLVISYNTEIVDVTELTMAVNDNAMDYTIIDGVIRIVYSNLDANSFSEGNVLFYIKGTVTNLTTSTTIINQVNGEFGDYNDEILNDIILDIPLFSPTTVTGVNSDNNNILVYPNPAKNYLNISNITNSKIEIYDIYGNLLRTENIKTNSAKIETENLSNGTYFIKIYKNEELITRKFNIIKSNQINF